MLGPLMLGVAGTQLTGEERERLAHPAVGGVLLFARNYEAPGQLLALTRSIRDIRHPPLLIAVDQEGGRVQRFRHGLTALPAAGRLGQAALEAPALAREAARAAGWVMAAELRALGVDFSFAPVLDLDRGISRVIGDRAFSDAPEWVADLALAWQRGVRAAGMVCVGKHFPGHGGTAPDSHEASAVDERALPDLVHTDLLPFRRLMDNGLAAVMMAHVVFPAVDLMPAGFAPSWVRYLRGGLGFEGAIFTDDLEMAAAEVAGGPADRLDAAIAAGCDMAVFGNAGRRADALLDRCHRSDPLSALRLARLHGRGGESLTTLHSSVAYREAREQLAGL
ncbi:beta-N-acetylhexosaminidase [Spiribacter sp. 221]|uniref:beta-N-acetylhexosaminidase n=1 Tax=Spiribacter onubensis TaxID=3122420 RepID=UPI00349F7F29